jgi:hypothetical protein
MYSEQKEQTQHNMINFAINVVITALLITFIALSEYGWKAFTVVPPYPPIQYPRFTAAPLENWKIKEINGS